MPSFLIIERDTGSYHRVQGDMHLLFTPCLPPQFHISLCVVLANLSVSTSVTVLHVLSFNL